MSRIYTAIGNGYQHIRFAGFNVPGRYHTNIYTGRAAGLTRIVEVPLLPKIGIVGNAGKLIFRHWFCYQNARLMLQGLPYSPQVFTGRYINNEPAMQGRSPHTLDLLRIFSAISHQSKHIGEERFYSSDT